MAKKAQTQQPNPTKTQAELQEYRKWSNDMFMSMNDSIGTLTQQDTTLHQMAELLAERIGIIEDNQAALLRTLDQEATASFATNLVLIKRKRLEGQPTHPDVK